MKIFIYILCFSLSFISNAQTDLSKLLKKHNSEAVPYISVEELKNILEATQTDVILLDAREPKEHQVSRIQDAVCVGYDKFSVKRTIKKLPIDKNAKIIVYCSLGIRSEDIAEKLQKRGYTNVYNLYGGIFEWKNRGNTVINTKNKPTEKVHTFNKEWSKWLLKGEKIYE